jgi:ubiquinone/menaquinone biosynthesis C-methylase UbiE
MTDEKTKRRSVKSACLEGRINENASAQVTDFNAWIFDRIPVKPDHNVLELCCGTGAQTQYFLKRVGKKGSIVALDISNDSLEILESKISDTQRSRLTLIESDLDLFDESLTARNIQKNSFDIIFCSYGLYYSKNAQDVMNRAKKWLKPNGSLVIVGPYGPNNKPLFNLLTDCGVTISEYIRFTSQDFMNDVVIPFGTLNFNTLGIRTLVNKIVWNSDEHVLTYWKNSTFYDNKKQEQVQARLNKHFDTESTFVNEKWVMLVIMKDE